MDNIFKRIQVKNGKYSKGRIRFKVRSHNRCTGGDEYYHGQVDYLGVYCPELNKCYLVPIDVPPTISLLRVDKPKNNQYKNIKWAKDFEI